MHFEDAFTTEEEKRTALDLGLTETHLAGEDLTEEQKKSLAGAKAALANFVSGLNRTAESHKELAFGEKTISGNDIHKQAAFSAATRDVDACSREIAAETSLHHWLIYFCLKFILVDSASKVVLQKEAKRPGGVPMKYVPSLLWLLEESKNPFLLFLQSNPDARSLFENFVFDEEEIKKVVLGIEINEWTNWDMEQCVNNFRDVNGFSIYAAAKRYEAKTLESKRLAEMAADEGAKAEDETEAGEGEEEGEEEGDAVVCMFSDDDEPSQEPTKPSPEPTKPMLYTPGGFTHSGGHIPSSKAQEKVLDAYKPQRDKSFGLETQSPAAYFVSLEDDPCHDLNKDLFYKTVKKLEALLRNGGDMAPVLKEVSKEVSKKVSRKRARSLFDKTNEGDSPSSSSSS
jgi:hypothetical protein